MALRRNFWVRIGLTGLVALGAGTALGQKTDSRLEYEEDQPYDPDDLVFEPGPLDRSETLPLLAPEDCIAIAQENREVLTVFNGHSFRGPVPRAAVTAGMSEGAPHTPQEVLEQSEAFIIGRVERVVLTERVGYMEVILQGTEVPGGLYGERVQIQVPVELYLGGDGGPRVQTTSNQPLLDPGTLFGAFVQNSGVRNFLHFTRWSVYPVDPTTGRTSAEQPLESPLGAAMGELTTDEMRDYAGAMQSEIGFGGNGPVDLRDKTGLACLDEPAVTAAMTSEVDFSL